MFSTADLRARWQQSSNDPDSLKALVRRDLTDWGRAQRGGLPNLGYHGPQHPGVKDDTRTVWHDLEKVDAITETLVLWNLEQFEIEDPDERREVVNLLMVLRIHFTSDAPAESKAKRRKVSRATWLRWVDEASFRFWVMHYLSR